MMQEINSVSQVNMYIKHMFARDYALNNISVMGEVSNCKYHSSGHIYFTIKDSASQLSCVMFSSMRTGLDFKMEAGQEVAVQGSISVYERDGKYQLYARKITRYGSGRLYEEYEKMKKRLWKEGLFDADRKKKIPAYAKSIGVVTAPEGAVIHDICNVAGRRNPYVQIYLYPAKVQGEGAEDTIIEGIKYFEKTGIDTIIIGRGGGSIEDLWVFNSERLARTVAACTKPVISAVGHETDVTIADFAADLRAPTPSAAAELAIYSYMDVETALRQTAYSLKWQINNILKIKRLGLEQYNMALRQLSPVDITRQKRLYLADCEDRLSALINQKLLSAKYQLGLYAEKLKGLSPLYKLKNGYSYITDMDGNSIKSAAGIQEGQQLALYMQDGMAEVTVNKTERNCRYGSKEDDT
ncbi:MAG TPA: exodeoxyribonuclease VII large subunit [Lachnospiraceae bacterium]|nr:exodeoxyribonuclease VII large subunit [Lachnospiraceae bacterium]